MLRKDFFKNYNTTTDKQLFKIANDLNFKINWIGFAEDIKNEVCQNGIYIINLGDKNIGGTHWTMLCIDNKHAFYFDSFAMPPEDEIVNFLMTHQIPSLNFNNKNQIQQIDKELCGIYCICCAYYLVKKKGSLLKRFNEFINDFNL